MANKSVRSGSTKRVAARATTVTKPATKPGAVVAATQVVAPKTAAATPAVAKPTPPAVAAVPKPEAAKPTPPAVKAETAKPALVETKVAVPEATPVAAKPVERAVAEVKAVAAPIAAAAVKLIEKPVEVAKAMATPIYKPAEKEIEKMATTVETNVNKTQADAQAMFGDMNARTKGAMEKSAKMVEEMNDFAKGNLEAMVESSRIAAKGMESIGQEAAEFSRKSFEQATATMKNMASVKSPTELFKLQSDFMRSAFDMYVAEASKTTEHMMKLAGDAAQPLSNRMAVAADKVKVAA